MRVLIADDEEHYRDYLRANLAEQGHQVSTVDTGRVAIDYGVRFRPHVLVTDWMLRDDIHGLRVSNVLRAVDPGLQAIVITGFPSTDLQRDARESGVYRFIEKPFGLDELVDAVRGAVAVKRSGRIAAFGVIEVDETGAVLSTNRKAQDMLARPGVDTTAARLEHLFGDEALAHLVDSNDRWVRATTLGREPAELLLRSRTWSGGGVLVALPASAAALQRDPLIETLLHIDAEEGTKWPFEEHVLILDRVREVRSLCAMLLEQTGCVCFKAESPKLARKLLEADEEVGIVILDDRFVDDGLDELVATLRSLRPGLKIVGASAEDDRRRFAEAGVDRVLDNGWEVTDLIAAVQD